MTASERHTRAAGTQERDANGDRIPPMVHKHVVVSRQLVMVNAASSVLARLLNVFALIWVYQYLLARIPADEFAIYPTVMAVMVFAPFFFSFFTGGVSRYIISAYALDDKTRVEEIVSSIVPLLVLISLLFCALGALLAIFVDVVLVVPPQMVGDMQIMVALLVGSFAIQMALLPFGVGFHVRQRFVELNILWLARDTLRIVLVFALLTLDSPAVIWLVVSTVIADLMHLTAVTLRSRALTPELKFRIRAFRWPVARTLVSFGIWTTLGRLAAMLYINAGVLVLNRFGTAQDVTLFYLAASLFQQIQGMISFARQPLQPSLVAMHALADRERLRRAAVRGATYGLWAALIVACPLAIFASQFVTLVMGPSFADGAVVIVLLMAVFVFNQPAGLLPMIAVATGQVRTFNVAAFISTALGFLAMVVVAGPLGLGAAGTAGAILAVSAAAQLVYFWPLNFRLTGMTRTVFVREVLCRGLAPAFAGSLVWLIAATTMDATGWVSLAVAVATGGVVYGATLLACLDGGDRKLVRMVWHKLRGRSRQVTVDPAGGPAIAQIKGLS